MREELEKVDKRTLSILSRGKVVASKEVFIKEAAAWFSKEVKKMDKTAKIVGECPRCRNNIAVIEGEKAFYCENLNCSFVLWKKNNSLLSRNASLSATNVRELLKEGQTVIRCKNRVSKPYKALFRLSDSGTYINLIFVQFVN